MGFRCSFGTRWGLVGGWRPSFGGQRGGGLVKYDAFAAGASGCFLTGGRLLGPLVGEEVSGCGLLGFCAGW
jgi:hypothetical protein